MATVVIAAPPPLPEPRAGAQAVVAQGKVFVFGGAAVLGGPHSRQVVVFDPTAGVWTRQPENDRDPVVGATVAMDDRIFALITATAASYDAATDTLAEYTPATGQWTTLGQLSPSRISATLVALEGRLLVVGGFEKPRNNVRLVESFDLSTRKWSRLAALRQGRHAAQAVAFDRQLYLLGGVGDTFREKVSEVERYDPATDTWTTVPGLRCPRAYFAAIPDGSAVFIVEGFTRVGAPLPIARMDLVNGETRLVGHLRRSRAHAAVVRVAEELWVIGGAGYRAPVVGDVEAFALER